MQPKCWFAACFLLFSLLLRHPSCGSFFFCLYARRRCGCSPLDPEQLLRSRFCLLAAATPWWLFLISLSFILPGVILSTARGRPAFKIETKENKISRCAVAWDLRLALVHMRVPALKEWNKGVAYQGKWDFDSIYWDLGSHRRFNHDMNLSSIFECGRREANCRRHERCTTGVVWCIMLILRMQAIFFLFIEASNDICG